MNDEQPTPAEDDVEAHAMRGRGRDEDAPPSDEVEREQVPDAADDVESHAYRSGR